MTLRIKTIEIRAFRGIPELNLNLDGKSFILRGENGTGKSSLVDAIEFFFSGKVLHLEGVQGLSLLRHGPHVHFTPDDTKVSMTFNIGNVELSRKFNFSPSIPEEFIEYFNITQKGNYILRRAQILEFIASKPADRFKAIGSIIGVEQLDNYELELKRLGDEINEQVTKYNALKNSTLNDLSLLLGYQIFNADGVLPAINAKLKNANLPLITSLDMADKHSELMLRTAKLSESNKGTAVISEFLVLLKSTSHVDENQLKAISNDVDSINQKIKNLNKVQFEKEKALADLLEIGGNLVKQQKMEICPLCEQTIDPDKLVERILIRQKTLQALTEEASEVRNLAAEVKSILSTKLISSNAILPRMDAIKELSHNKELLAETSEYISALIAKVTSAADIKNELSVDEINKEIHKIENLIKDLQTECERLLKETNITEEEKKVLEIVGLIGNTKAKVQDLLKADLELKKNKQYAQIADKLYSTFSEVKKAKVQAVFDMIQTDIQGYYSILHLGEPHNNLQLKTVRRASIELTIQSFGRPGEDPRALTSEGHLDSLGLCIFLAFVKKFNVSCPLVVLDDVVTTIDAAHRENICKLLHQEFGDKQFIITTHDGIWFEQLRASRRAYGIDGSCIFMTVSSWDVENGMILRPYKPRWERIMQKIQEGDKSAGNDSRTYLEWILEQACEATQTLGPLKFTGKYEIGELLPALRKRITLLVNDISFQDKIAIAFRNLDSTIIYGNILSHNNTLAEGLSITEISNFCNAVHALHEILSCQKCGSFAVLSPQFNILRCKCGGLELKAKH
jgi:recombinational DNA repair ATPase RecF